MVNGLWQGGGVRGAGWRRWAGTWALAWALAVLTGGWGGRAMALGVRMEVDRDSVEVGESFVLSLVIEGVQAAGQPGNLPIPGVRLRYLGPATQMQSMNGQTTIQVSHRFLATPEGTNDVVIPSFNVQVNNQVLSTQEVRVRVVPAESHAEPVWLKVVVDRDSAFVGETFPVEVQLYFQSVKDATPPRLDLDGFVMGRAAEPRHATTMRGNEQWSVVSWRFAVTASKPGDIKVGPAELDLTLLTAVRGRQGDLFDDFFGQPRNARRMTVKGEGKTLKVSHPPAAGRPPGYAGVVGQFQLSASVNPARVNVGDPVTVRVTVQGQGGIERMELPAWPETASLRVYPGTNGFAASDALGLSGTRTLEYVVVPERAGKVRLPVPSLVSFDPVARAYRTASAGEVVLEVLAGAGGAAEGALSAAGTPGGVTNRPAGGESPATAWRSGPGVRREGGRRWGAAPWVGGVALAPWLAWAGVVAGRACHRRWKSRPAPPAREGWRREVEEGRATLEAGEGDLAACGRVVRGWLGWWMDREPGTVTAEVALRAMAEQGVDDAAREAVAGWFAEWEARRYAPQGGEADAGFRAETLRVVGLLEAAWKREGEAR